MPELYSAQTAEQIVPEIMERQVARLRALVDPAIRSPSALPLKGGWNLIARERQQQQRAHMHAIVSTDPTASVAGSGENDI